MIHNEKSRTLGATAGLLQTPSTAFFPPTGTDRVETAVDP
jgi:hypothetical protein